MSEDLKGITVVAVEQAVAAPFASRCLADAGARVIKVERPEGDFARDYDRAVADQSAYFVWLNRGKESVRLDLKVAADHALLHAMIAQADVFLQNLRPNLLQGLGFGAASLRATRPELITCEITGFGRSGPGSRLKAYDLIVQAESGLCAITGEAGRPARVGVSVCDISAGMTAHAAILQALFARDRSGRGRAIEVSLFDSIAEWMTVPLLQQLHGGQAPTPAGVSHPTIAPYGAFVCGDGADIILAVQNDREWTRFCDGFLHRPDLRLDARFIDNVSRVAHRPALDAVVAARFLTLDAASASKALEAHDIAHGVLNSLQAASQHPHLRWATIHTPGGEIRVVAPAAVTDRADTVLRPVPALGQHDSALRAEFHA